jgi:hypothetical protein
VPVKRHRRHAELFSDAAKARALESFFVRDPKRGCHDRIAIEIGHAQRVYSVD